MDDPFSRTLIIGSGGMLASALRDALSRRGVQAVGVDRGECDVTDASQLRGLFERVRPTMVFNCAAYTNVDRCETDSAAAMLVNGTAPGLIADCCATHDAKLIHYSTDYVFDGTLRRPLRPEDPVGPTSAYGRSKLAGEVAVRQVDPPGWLIVRTAWLYGPGGSSFPRTMLTAARAGKPLRVIADQTGSPTFTRDLADASLALVDARAAGTFHLTNAGQTNWFDFAREIFEVFGVTPVALEPITSDDWKQIKPDSAIRPTYSVLDTTDYTRATGQTLPHWRDALRRFAAEQEA